MIDQELAIVEPKKAALYRIEDQKLILDLHPGQTRAWDSTKRFVFVIAGTQGGKTSFGPFWLWREIMNCGSGDYLAVTSNYDLFKLKMLPEMLNVFVDILGCARYHAGERILEVANPLTGQFEGNGRADDPKMWARIILRSAEAKSGLESSSAKAAWLDECGQPEFVITTWEAVLRRLSLAEGRVLATTTPYDLGWLKTEIVDPWERGDEEIDVIRFPSIVNPAFPKKEYRERRKKMPDWRFRMMYQGIFTRPAGMIYSDFIDEYKDDGGHKVVPFDVPKTWPRWVGVDPGANNTAKIWFAKDPVEGVFYLYRESLEGNKSTKEHAQGALALAKRSGERVIRWYVGNQGEKQQRLDWKEAGVKNVKEPWIADVESGIDFIIELLKEFRLYIFDDCIGVLDEIMRYSRELDKAGQPTEKIKNKETFHRLDALRYVAVGVKQKKGVMFA